MNSNLVLFGLILLLSANGTINSTQTLLLLALMTTTVCNCNNTGETTTRTSGLI